MNNIETGAEKVAIGIRYLIELHASKTHVPYEGSVNRYQKEIKEGIELVAKGIVEEWMMDLNAKNRGSQKIPT